MLGRVFSINIGKKKGEGKEMVVFCLLKKGFGIEGDAHAGSGERQVSLLSVESIEALENEVKPSGVELMPGMFAENITTQGLDLLKLKIGERLNIGDKVVLKIVQIGKACHSGCGITKKIGRCIMPKQGIFASVETGGLIKIHDLIKT